MVDTQTLGDQSELSTAINGVSLEIFCFGFLSSKWRLYPPIGIFVILLYYKWKGLAHSSSQKWFFPLSLRFNLFPVFKKSRFFFKNLNIGPQTLGFQIIHVADQLNILIWLSRFKTLLAVHIHQVDIWSSLFIRNFGYRIYINQQV